MARPLRIEFEGALYHVTARGDRREDIFVTDTDRADFLGLVEHVVETCNWQVHAYCLMDNHYHLLVETPDANLSRGMRQLNGVYTQLHNRNNKRVGHVFQGRYKAILVQKEAYLLELARYIVLNPVRAGMITNVGLWPWSSYPDTAGLRDAPGWLHTEWLLSVFGRRLSSARRKYQKFVAEGRPHLSPWENLRNQVFLGSEDFVDQLRNEIESDKDLSEIPRSQRQEKPPALTDFDRKFGSRDESIQAAYASGGYSMKEIGAYFGLHYSRVSRILKQQKQRAKDKT